MGFYRKLGDAIDSTVESVSETAGKVYDYTKENPVKASVGAAVGGVAALAMQAKAQKKNANIKVSPLKPVFEVVVMATMSAGKSTLINALIGQDLLPSSNEACTSRIFKIEDIDEHQGFTARVGGGDSESNPWIDVTTKTLKEMNDSIDDGIVHIQGDIPTIYNHDLRLVIYDTPGPNNSQNKQHEQLTKQLLHDGNYGLIIYVLNATQLHVDDDVQLLHDLQQILSEKDDCKDVVFVLNKADALDEELGESIELAVKELTLYLERHGFKSPQILSISSRVALSARNRKNNIQLTRKEDRFLDGILEQIEEGAPFLGDYSTLQETIESHQIESRLQSNNTEQSIESLILYSGVKKLERVLQKSLSNVSDIN